MLISEGIYALMVDIPGPLKTVNCYLIIDGNDSYLVDTMWPASMSQETVGYTMSDDTWSKLLGLFEEADVDPKKLRGIIMTHAHPDHIGYMPELIELTGAPILLHPHELQENTLLIQKDEIWQALKRVWFRQHGVPAEIMKSLEKYTNVYKPIPLDTSVRTVADGEVIPVGSMRWEVIWTPGHSLGHICLMERSKGILITGDHILPHDTPVILTHPALRMLHPNPLGNYINSIRRMKKLSVLQALPAHGDVINNFQSEVSRLLVHHNTRFEDIIETLRDGSKCAFSVACAIPWIGRKKHFMQLTSLDRWMALTETIAHLRDLEKRNVVETVFINHKIQWNLLLDK
jgi:glyoxylase-like metal-dependent hydrolase (beta-lactamase superfamily II)